jgi:sugar lactone lactonase YvrE
MKADGTVLFVLNVTDDTIYQYSLSTPYDITTASYDSKSFAVTSQDATPRGLEVKPDGTKLYIAGDTNNTVYEYNLSTAWDISTASYSSNSFSVNSQISATSFNAVSFKSDGTSFYALAQGTGIYQYDLTTAWDVSTASYVSKSLTTSSQDTQVLDMEFATDGTKVYISGGANDTVFQYNLSTAWDLSTASYSSISFSITSQATAPNGIAISDSGKKMYIGDSDTDVVYQYSISATTYITTFDCENANVFETELDGNATVVFSNPPASGTPVVNGYQISSAAYASKSFSVASQEGTPRAVEFKTDGTKMYVLGSGADTVFQYALSTAWDVSTASYESKSFSVATQQTVPDGIRFKPDGTKFYIIGDTPDSVHQYSMSTAWDISTASYDSVTFSVSSQLSQTTGLFFKSDGLSFYAVGAVNDTVYQYTLSTAWDLSTASYSSKSFSVASQATLPTDVNFNDDGTKMFVQCLNTDFVYQYSLSTAWDVSTASYDSVSFSTVSQEINPYACTFGDSGTKMYVVGNSTDTIYQYSTSTTTYSTTFDCENANVFETELEGNTTVVFSNPPASGTPVPSTSYDIAEATVVTTLDISSQENQVQALFVKPDGTSLYIVGSGSDTVYQYNFTTAFDLSTASYASKSFSITAQEPAPTSLFFKSDGTKMYVLGGNQDSVFQYSLSTAWDVSTASYDSVSFSVSSQDTSPGDLTFSSDGTKMYVLGRTNDSVYQYTLSTAWDVSTASYASKSLSVTSQDIDPVALVFNNDGTELFVSGADSDDIFKYTLTTAYDVSTGSYASVSFAPATVSNMGIQFGDSGKKMYIANESTDVITEYTVYQTSLNDSTAYAMSLKVVQDSGASGYTVTWPTSVDWPAATAPTLTATASAVDQFVLQRGKH